MQIYFVMSVIPILAAIAAMLFLRKGSIIRYLSLAASATPLFFLPYLYSSIGSSQSISWFRSGSTVFQITASMYQMNFILFALVSIVAPLVFLYSIGYINEERDAKGYYTELLSFEAAMLIFAMAGDFILLLVAWSFLSITSYLLIGFYNTGAAKRAARKSLTTVFIGDIAILAALVILLNSYSTLQFSQIISAVSATAITKTEYIAFILLIIAAFTKSAQFPFNVWLPDAMEGPTPVSAFLHSSTMVKAGVFMLLVLFPIFQAAHLLGVILAFALFSAIISVLGALGESHVKRVLAYSTIEELSIMLVALSINAISAALYIFIIQAFYKSLLFFYSGILTKANGSDEINNMHESQRGKLMAISGLIGVLSLAGFIPFNSFFANAILGQAAMSYNLIVYVVLLAIDFGVSFAIFRWFLLPLRPSSSSKAALNIGINYSLINDYMKLSLYLAAAFSVLSVAIFLLPGVSGMESVYKYAPAGISNVALPELAVSATAVLLGLAAAYFLFFRVYRKKSPASTSYLKAINSALDSLYGHLMTFFTASSVVLTEAEMAINDIFDGIAMNTSRGGYAARRMESGSINFYSLIFIIGALLLILYAFFWMR